MKRDFELIRKLLIFFRDSNGEIVKVPPVEGFDALSIKYHCVLLYQAGFLSCEPILSSSSERVIEVWSFDLTWSGHEFADKILDESTWNKIKDTVSSKGGVLAFGVINGLATKYAQQQLGL